MSRNGRLYARPGPILRQGPTGLQPLDAGGARDSYLYVPPCYRPDDPSPLLLMLHGSGGHAQHGLETLRELADDTGIILAAPVSTGYTWDVHIRRYGPDLDMIDAALEHVFTGYAIDPTHVATGGFSDGASYALSLGVTNGDVFTHVIAFSPGFIAPAAERNGPRIFISHGTRDEILPISACSRRIVPQLERVGFEVEYVEFEGGHRIPPEIARRAIEWFTGSPVSAPGSYRPRRRESRPRRED